MRRLISLWLCFVLLGSSTCVLFQTGIHSVAEDVDCAEAIYPVIVNPLLTTELLKLTAGDGVGGDIFGSSVSISDDTTVIGAYGDDSQMGSAYIFSRNQGGMDGWGEVTKLTASDGASGDRFGNNVSISGDTIVIGSPGNNNQGAAYVFVRNQGGVDNWGQVKKLIASDGAVGDNFGCSVSISGDTIVVGANGDNSNMGSAYIFSRNQGGTENWGEVIRIVASDGVLNDLFGSSVSIFYDTIVIGAYADNSNQGAAYVYAKNQGGIDNWGQVKKLIASDAAVNDFFGYSISINYNTIIIGATGDNSNQGAGYVFAKNQGGTDNWGEIVKLMADDGTINDYFGNSVSIFLDTIIIGADNDNSSQGSTYLFTRNKNDVDNWGQVAKLTASDGTSNDFFGVFVSLSYNTIIIGAYGYNSMQGSAYIFNCVGTSWIEQSHPLASDGTEYDYFGCSVSISGDTMVIGAFGAYPLPPAPGVNGQAYVLMKNQGGSDNWGEVKKLTASDGAANDYFGFSVSISGDTIVVGASMDDTGINIDQGSAYIFSRNQGGSNNWGQVKKMYASDGTVSDHFGESVSISGDTIVVTSKYDNSNQGAAYIYKRNQGGADNWGQVKKIVASDGLAGDRFGSSVCISGETIIVGAYYDNSQIGSAYIFTRNQGGPDNWGELTKLAPSDGAVGDLYGYSVSISTDIIVVGAYYNDVGSNSNQGSTYIYSRNQGGPDNWGEVVKLTASDGAANDIFGNSVSVSDDTIIVGATNDNGGQGAAYIFARNHGGPDNWGEVQKLTTSDGGFGHSTSILGNTIVSGAYYGGSAYLQGSAYVFNFVYENHPPTINTTEVTSGTEDTLYYVDYNATDSDTWNILTWNLSTNAPWLTIDNATGVLSGTPDNSQVQSFSVEVSVNDGNGGIDWNNFTLTISNVNPVIITPDNVLGTEDIVYSVDYNSDDDGQGIITWNLWTDADFLSINPTTGNLSGTPDNSDVWTWTVNVTVNDGNGGLDWSNFTLTIDNAKPSIITPDTLTFNEDDVYSTDYDSDDDGQGTITWGLWTNSDFLSINPSSGILTGTPDNTDIGNWIVNVTVNDGNGGNDWTNFTLTVNNINPIISTPDVTTWNEDTLYSTDYNSDDDGQGTITWDLWTETDFLTINPSSGILSGTPDNTDVGNWLVNVTVDDGHSGIDWSNFTLTINNVNPSILTGNQISVNEDSFYSVDYDSDEDGQGTITWSLWTDADFLTINVTSGVLSGLPDNTDAGNWTVNVTVDDGNGGQDWSNFTLTVNDVINIMTTDVTACDEDSIYSVDYDSDDDGLGIILWTLWTEADFLTLNPTTGVLSGTPDNTDAGTWTVNVTVSDGYGGLDWSNFTLTVNALINIISSDDTSADEDSLYIIDYASDDDGQGTITWNVWSDADFLSIDSVTGILSGTPDNTDIGPWMVNVTVDDGKGGTDWSNFTLTVSNVNPNISNSNVITVDEDSTYNVDYNSDDDGQGVITWNLWSDADFLTIGSSNGVLSGTPDNSDVGTWTVNITVDDGNGGTDWANYTLTVNNVNPSILSSNQFSVDENSLYSVDYDSSDDGQGTITWSLWTSANFLAIDPATGILEGTPGHSDAGTWAVNVSVDDGNGGLDWTNFTLTVQSPPIISTADVTIAAEDSLYSVDYDAVDLNLDILTWKLWTNCHFLSINSTTGLLNGMPDNTDVGTWTVNVTVTDSAGDLDWANFTLTVANLDPEIATTDVLQVIAGNQYSVDYNSTDDGQGSITWSSETNATWLSIDSVSGVLSGSPGNELAGTYWVNVSVNDGNGGKDSHNFTVEVSRDTDGDGTPDSTDMDDDNDGIPDTADAFPLDPTESIDTDGDEIGNNADIDDDGDGVPDDIDLDPLDPAVGEIVDDSEIPEEGGSGNYLWIIIIIILAGVLGAIFLLRKKSEPVTKEITEEPIPETEPCPKCGFDIEKGTKCPFCTEEKPPRTPEPPKAEPPTSRPRVEQTVTQTPQKKTPLSREEMIARIEKAYKEGKMNEEQYLRNLEKFRK